MRVRTPDFIQTRSLSVHLIEQFAPESLLEEDGFELLVPVVKRRPPREK